MRTMTLATNLMNFTKLMEQMGVALDDKSAGGSKITAEEANTILGAVDGLPREDRALAATTLIGVLQSDLLDVSDDVRKIFADKFNMAPAELTPRQVADLAGRQAKRTAFEHGVKTLSKTTRATKKTVKALFDNVTKDAPPMVRSVLAAAMEVAQSEGLFRLDSDARPLSRRFRMGNNPNGEVDFFKQLFNSEPAGPAARLSNMMANATSFEDFMSAIFFYIAAVMQEEIRDKGTELDQHSHEVQRRMDVQAEGLPGESKAKAMLAENTKYELKSMTPGQQAETKKVLESVINAADTALKRNYDGVDVQMVDGKKVVTKLGLHKDGFISQHEAGRIAAKLERLCQVGPPADVMMAHSITTALLSSDQLDNVSMQNLASVLAWGQKTLAGHGINIDISKRMKKGASLDPQSDLSAALLGAEGVPALFAGFMVNVFSKESGDLSETMKLYASIADKVGDTITAQGGDGLDKSEAAQMARSQQMSNLQAKGGAVPEGLDAKAQADAIARAATAPAPKQAAATDSKGPVVAAPVVDPHRYVSPTEMSDQKLQQSRADLNEQITDLSRQLRELMMVMETVMSTFHQMAMNSIKAI